MKEGKYTARLTVEREEPRKKEKENTRQSDILQPGLLSSTSSAPSDPILTWCKLDGPGIACRCGRDFQQPSVPVLGPTQPPLQWLPRLFPWGKAAGACL